MTDTANAAAMEAAQFQRELQERLGPASLDIVSFDHDALKIGERIIVEQGNDFRAIAGVDVKLDGKLELEPVDNQRNYLRHDPKKNTKRQMRRAKGRT